MKITGQEVREAMQANGITYVEHHDCAGCGYMTNYTVFDGTLYFDPGCNCTNGAGLRRTTFDEAADWINMQTRFEVAQRLAAKFGLVLDPPASVIAGHREKT